MKYIVNTDDFKFTPKTIVVIGIAGCVSKNVDVLEELNSDYINEHFGELQDTAYQKGLEEGKKAFDLLESERNSEYQRGLEDAWKAARKITHMWHEDRMECFGLVRVYSDLTASEAIEKLKAYEKKQSDKIKVGDEVKLCSHKDSYIVTSYEQDNDMCILMSVRGGFFRAEKCDIRKTGRHFDIEKILEEMKK